MEAKEENRICQNCKNDFTIEPDDFGFYEKIKVPPPTFCPECRMIRRMTWRNNRSLHKRNCNLCNQPIITMYRDDGDFPVFCNPCWWGDGWDSKSYAVDIDFTRPFLEQWFELYNKVPKFAKWVVGNTKNSDFTNNLINSTDCYLSYSTVGSEYIMYSENIDDSRSLVDSYNSISCELGYEVQGTNNYMSSFLSQCKDCIDSSFLFDCINSTNCFMSSNLRNKKYIFRNKQLSKENYEKMLENENLDSRISLKKLRGEWIKLMENSIHQYARIVSAPNSTGNFIRNAKNVKHSFTSHDIEDISYSMRTLNSKDSMDVYGLGEGELIYETVACSFGTYKNLFSTNSNGTSSIYYSAMCQNGSDLFGCVAIKKNSYFILNKQYTKEEYYTLIPKVIEHMNDMPYVDKKGRIYKYGEFPPSEFSPFGYNETLAQDFFPLSKDEVEEKGYNFFSLKDKDYKITIPCEEIPDSILDTPDSIVNEIFECRHAQNGKVICNQQCTTAFRVTTNEFNFYKKMKIPLPDLCPNCRYYERLPVIFQPLHLWHRDCMCDKKHNNHEGKCEVEFETPYAPGRPEVLYCEKCYQQEVY